MEEGWGDLAPAEKTARLVELLAAGDYSLRYAAAEALGNLGELHAIPGLVAVLSDPDPVLRWCSATALQRITGEDYGIDHRRWQAWWESHRREEGWDPSSAWARLLSQLRDSDYRTRYRTAQRLAREGRRDAVPALIGALEDESPAFRWEVARTLRVLTGRDFGIDRGRWLSWWKEVYARGERLDREVREWLSEYQFSQDTGVTPSLLPLPQRGRGRGEGADEITAPVMAWSLPSDSGGSEVPTREYTIRAGDSLSLIAYRLGTTVETLLRLNPQIRNKHRIYAGHRLLVPAS
jgi:hypothetical protein